MNSYEAADVLVSAREQGCFLRLETPGKYAMRLAVDLLGFLRAELDAEVPVNGWQSGRGIEVSEPIHIQLEGLQVELLTDGSDIEVRRVGGSGTEFDELCELLLAECARG